MIGKSSCPVCGSESIREVMHIQSVPAHCCILWEKRQQAIDCPKGDIRLNFCHECGHLYNEDFDENLMTYSENYENSLHFSPKFQKYSIELIKRLTSTYNLQNKNILEIGCGKGDFLKMICQYGNNQGYGFDKSYQPELEESKPEEVEYIKDYYSEKYADYPADLILTRYVLEHIPDPYEFLLNIKNTAHSENNNEIVFYFEVPNILYTLRDFGIWDLIYEHCSHFSAPSLTRLFEKLGFKVMNVEENYMGQFLSIETSTINTSSSNYSTYIDVDEVRDLVDRFATVFNQKIADWKNKLQEFQRQGKKIVVWGGGSKGVSFLNFLETKDFIHHIVDINPRKQGKFIAGTGQQYIMPEELTKIKPDTVIIMNPIYKEEIKEKLSELNLSPEIFIA